MVTNATSLGRSGLADWVIQRVSAIVIALYVVLFLGFLVTHPNLDFVTWVTWLRTPFMQFATTLFMISLGAHAWIGVWTIFTDYVKNTALRFILQALMIIASVSYVLWGIRIIWSL